MLSINNSVRPRDLHFSRKIEEQISFQRVLTSCNIPTSVQYIFFAIFHWKNFQLYKSFKYSIFWIILEQILFCKHISIPQINTYNKSWGDLWKLMMESFLFYSIVFIETGFAHKLKILWNVASKFVQLKAIPFNIWNK